nr:MAG TPA: hypothetical protein [Caudoviricetes sp.]
MHISHTSQNMFQRSNSPKMVVIGLRYRDLYWKMLKIEVPQH